MGRQFRRSKEDKELDYDDLVRGYETDGKMVVITDEELESVAPEMSGDIELRNFVPLEQIPPMYFQRPYFLAPSGKSVKAYSLLTATMERTGGVGIGSFVMRAQGLEAEDEEAAEGGAQIIDLMEVLRKSLSKRAVVTTADSGPPISLAARRASTKRKASVKAKAPRKRGRSA